LDDGRLSRLLRRFFDVRPGESRAALFLFVYFFLITFTIYIIKTVKETFLIGINPRFWPYPDLITVGLIGFVIALNARLLNRLSRRLHASQTVIFFASNLLIFWFIFDMNYGNTIFSPTVDSSGLLGVVPLLVGIKNSWPAPVIVFSFWCDIFIATSVTHFWIAVNDVFKVHQVKRTVGFFVTGGILGGIGGAFLTWLLGRSIGPTNLLLVCPAVMGLMLGVINAVYGQAKKVPEGPDSDQARALPRVGYLESLRTVRQTPYLRILAALLFSAMVVGSLVNYQFKSIVKALIPNDVLRTSFMGSFFFWILVISAVLHLATTSRILKTFGIRMALLVAPVVLLTGSAVFFFLPVSATAAMLMGWACFMRGSDKTFDNTISQSVRELLYIPIPPDIKYRAKMFIDMFVNKFAVGFGAVLYWVLYRALSFGYKDTAVQVREIAYVVIAFATLWVVLTGIIYAGYMGALKGDLQRIWQEAHKKLEASVDVESIGLVVDLLQSREKSTALYLMNLFRIVRKEKLTPELREVLAVKEDELKARSMDSLLDVGGEMLHPEFEETDPDRDLAKVIEEVFRLDSFKALMGGKLAEIVDHRMDSEVSRMEAALLTGLMEPTPEVLQAVGRLLQDPSPEVLNYALGSAAIHRHKEHIPLIIPLLGNPTARQVAQTALAAYGPDICEALRRSLEDEAERLEVRKAVPDVLARVGGQRAADILAGYLARGGEELEQELVEALYKVRSDQSGVLFKKKKIIAAILSLVKRCYAVELGRAGERNAVAPAGPGPDRHGLLDLRIKLIFDLLSLVYPPDDIAKAYQNILKGTEKSVDFSLELLDNLLDRNLKTFFFPLIDDIPIEDKLRLLRKLGRRLDRASP
jgi:AAA family ATP:ADP antiporter